MTNHILQVVQRHKTGERVGVYSVCSAHPLVIEAACRQALADESFALVEATSNQVDQFGGYTGMTPADFRDLVYKVAEQVGLSRDRVVLGGDHLGPNRWRARSSGEAMSHAERLIEGYVAAGFSKIHLDCSMACADDRMPLTDEVVATRAARLAAVAERIAVREFGNSSLLYVVGTEVPVPGGAQETLVALSPTEPAAARATIAAHRVAFDDAGISAAWSRLVGLVAQPGVEFDHHQVIDYRHDRASNLSQVVDGDSNLVFEAHSTDYQTQENLAVRLLSCLFALSDLWLITWDAWLSGALASKAHRISARSTQWHPASFSCCLAARTGHGAR